MNDYYPVGAARFSNPFQNRNQYGFQQFNNSTQYRQFHEMKSEMPSDVLELFRANQIGFLRAPVKKKCRSLDPVSVLGMNLSEVFSIPNLQLMEEEKKQTKAERIDRIAQQKLIKHKAQVKQKMSQWNPFLKQRITVDPYNTLFVGRLSFKTTQKDLKYEFQDDKEQPRGYGFVQFQIHQDFVTAYKHANHRRINGRRVIIDLQRGRTSLSWRPRRLDGGLGGENRMNPQQYQKYIKELKVQKQIKRQRSKGRERSRSRNKNHDRRKDEDRYYQKQRQKDDREHRNRDHRKKDRRSKDRKQRKEKKQRRQKRE